MRAKRTALRKNEFSPFTFAQISDSHLLASGTEWDARVEKIINTIQAREPSVEFILHTGDLVDAASKEAVQAFRTKFSANKLPLHVVPGNHDVWNARVSGEGAPWWTRTTTTTDQQQFRQWFGATCYSVMYRDCAFVAFNSQLMNTALTEEQEQWEWLEAELQRLDELNAVHIVLFTHMPLFVRTPDEQLDWNDWRNSYLAIAPPAREHLLDLIEKHRVTAYLSGHLHYPLQSIQHWSPQHTTSFITCDASGPVSKMAQEQFQLPPMPRYGYCLHHVERERIVTEFVDA